MSEKKLSEKVILITGAARGLGRSMALALAAEGASLALVDIDGEELKDTAIEIEKINGRDAVIPLGADVGDPPAGRGGRSLR